MLAEFIDSYGLEIVIGLGSVLGGVVLRELRKRGLDQAAAIIEASAPYIIDIISKGRKKVPTTGDFAMRQAKRAALGSLPLTAKVLAPIATAKVAKEALQYQYDNGKRLKSIGIGATVDGKELAGEIKAGFKRGDIRATIGTSNGKMKAFAGGTFRF